MVTTLAPRSIETAIGRWLGRAGYLRKWVALGVAIGVIAGIGAVVFYLALTGATHLLLENLGGYTPPKPVGEGGSATGFGHVGWDQFTRPWAIPLVVCLGGLASGFLVFTFAPEAEGHGTDSAIEAVHKNPRMIRMRAVVVKLVASAITIGSGGSGGREGPTAQISAGFGSLLARRLDLSPEDGRIAVSVGIGAGIGAIFGAPLGGAVLAGAIVYRDDFETEALVPGLITSIVSYTVFGSIMGFAPLFGYAAQDYRFDQPLQLVWFAIIGLAAGLVGLAYVRGFYGIGALFQRLRPARMVKPALGGLLVGLLGLALPEVLGSGYGWVQESLDRSALLALPLWVVLVLPFAKILATALSIGSGGSGGIFGPGMVIGAFVGAAVWRLLEPIAPQVPHSPAPFVIVGMMACFGSAARAPLAVMLMVAEMTGSLTILAPAMVAVGLAYLIVRHFGATIYRAQLTNRDEARASRMRRGLPLLARIPVASAMAEPQLVLDARTTVDEARRLVDEAAVPGAPVIDVHGRYVGAFVPRAERSDGAGPVGHRVDATAPTMAVDATLFEAFDALPDGHRWLTVLDHERHVRGIVAVGDIVRAYRRAADADIRRIDAVAPDAEVLEVRVGSNSPVEGRPLAEGFLPAGTLVVSVSREGSVHAAEASTVMGKGNLVTVLAAPAHVDRVRVLLSGSPTEPS